MQGGILCVEDARALFAVSCYRFGWLRRVGVGALPVPVDGCEIDNLRAPRRHDSVISGIVFPYDVCFGG